MTSNIIWREFHHNGVLDYSLYYTRFDRSKAIVHCSGKRIPTVCSDEGLTFETSQFSKSFTVVIRTLSTRLLKPNLHIHYTSFAKTRRNIMNVKRRETLIGSLKTIFSS